MKVNRDRNRIWTLLSKKMKFSSIETMLRWIEDDSFEYDTIPSLAKSRANFKELMSSSIALQQHGQRINRDPSSIINNFRIFSDLSQGDINYPGMDITNESGNINPSYLSFVRSLRTEISSKVKGGTYTNEGFLDYGEPLSAFDGLGTIMSHAMPLSLIPFGRQSTAKPSDEDRLLFERLCTIMLSDKASVGSVKHPTNGSTSIPYWYTDSQSKIELIDTIKSKRMIIRDSIIQGEWGSLERMGVMNSTFIQTRRQAESPAKLRPVVKYDDLAHDSTAFMFDKRILDHSFGVARIRPVHALNAGLNWGSISYILKPRVDAWKNKYPQTLKLYGIDDLSKWLEYGHAISVDVSQFDNNIPVWFFRSFFKVLVDTIGEEWTYPIWAGMFSPLVFPNTRTHGAPMFFSGANNLFLIMRGLASGHSMNVPFGSVVGCFECISLLMKSGLVSKETKVEDILAGKTACTFKAFTDDWGFRFPDEQSKQQLITYIKKVGSSNFTLEVDEHFSLLGMIVISLNGVKRVVYKASSWIQNMICAERPVTKSSKRSHRLKSMRPYPFTGLEARDELYLSRGSPQMEHIFEIFERTWYDTQRIPWNKFKRVGTISEATSHLSEKDRLFLTKPELQHYNAVMVEGSNILEQTSISQSFEELNVLYP